tara:strand:- start:5064 stop:5864 length:801 start_codon:yes stop_codon:yes gene_type:complete
MIKKYLVIGNPVEHSISPKIHNYWFNKNKINATYDKKNLKEENFEKLVKSIRDGELAGANITVPFKEKIIPFLDILSVEAEKANSVNTVFLKDNRIVGHNTDIAGFYLSLKNKELDLKEKNVLILGTGGVTPSIIIALKKLGLENITVSNRTKSKAIKLKERFNNLKILDWGKTKKVDFIINSTSLGLKETDIIELDYKILEPNTFFYDVIYNPQETNFLKGARKNGHNTQNGLMMFIYQAAEAFKMWHGIKPEIDNKLINFISND